MYIQLTLCVYNNYRKGYEFERECGGMGGFEGRRGKGGNDINTIFHAWKFKNIWN